YRELIRMHREEGLDFSRGLINYNADDLDRIKGLHTQHIADTLGHRPYDEVIHRDNMVITRQGRG
ncbi:MAG: glutamate 5-kinase, partial [Patescibacteria group bacterium]|nr:glutamate 5-kinase [Patescibacteria group bacterium]